MKNFSTIDRDPAIVSPKALQILAGAASAFLELGYEGASVDEIARRAKVSKPTLYAHFSDKRALFAAFVRRECEQQARGMFAVDLAGQAIEPVLRIVGERLLDVVLSPFGQDVFRVVVAEATRFPELGRIFYASAVDLSVRRLAVMLAAAVGRGELRIDDVELASHQFLDLCRVELAHRRLFEPEAPLPEGRRAYIVDAAVRVFMRAHRP